MLSSREIRDLISILLILLGAFMITRFIRDEMLVLLGFLIALAGLALVVVS